MVFTFMFFPSLAAVFYFGPIVLPLAAFVPGSRAVFQRHRIGLTLLVYYTRSALPTAIDRAMKSGKRRALQIAGAAVLAGAGVLAWRAIDQGVFSAGAGAAYDPWTTWDARPPEGPLHLVHA